MAKRKLLTIHAPVRFTPSLARLIETIALEFRNPVAEHRADGLVVYLDSWQNEAP